MSMGSFSFGGYGSSGSSQGAEANRKANNAQTRIRYLEANLGRAFLICEALWEILRDRAKISEQEFHDKLYEIDMRDGQVDGQNQRQVVQCPKCLRKVSPRHQACIYCGEIVDDSVFTMT